MCVCREFNAKLRKTQTSHTQSQPNKSYSTPRSTSHQELLRPLPNRISRAASMQRSELKKFGHESKARTQQHQQTTQSPPRGGGTHREKEKTPLKTLRRRTICSSRQAIFNSRAEPRLHFRHGQMRFTAVSFVCMIIQPTICLNRVN